MAGFVAVITHDRRGDGLDQDLGGLEQAYRQLRGSAPANRFSIGDWVRAVQFQRSTEASPTGAAWVLGGALRPGADPAGDAPADLRGRFALLRHDAVHDRLELISDPLGMFRIYVAEQGDRTYVATSALVLARHLGADPDELGMLFYLRAGTQYGPLTHWKGIERVEPGTVLTFSRGKPRRATYALPRVDDRFRGLSKRATADLWIETFMDALGPEPPEGDRPWADLTGGFDSRLVLLLLTAAGRQIVADTNGGDDSKDVRLARAVAGKTQVPWEQFTTPADWTVSDDALAHAVAWGDGTLDALQLAEVLLHQDAKSRRSEVLFSGGGGEHLAQTAWVQEYPWAHRARRMRVNLAAQRWLRPVDLSVLADERRAEVEEHCRELFARRAALYADESAAVQCDAVFLYKTAGHYGAYRSANEAHLRQELPFYYQEVFSATFSANPLWRNGHGLHREMIERLNPAAAAIVTTDGAPAQRLRAANAHRFGVYYGKILRNAVVGMRQRWRPRRAKINMSLGPAVATVRRLQADGVLDPREMRSAWLYREAPLRELVGRTQQEGAAGLSVVSRIATLELALRAADHRGAELPGEHKHARVHRGAGGAPEH